MFISIHPNPSVSPKKSRGKILDQSEARNATAKIYEGKSNMAAKNE
jgi:hypothetical protein